MNELPQTDHPAELLILAALAQLRYSSPNDKNLEKLLLLALDAIRGAE